MSRVSGGLNSMRLQAACVCRQKTKDTHLFQGRLAPSTKSWLPVRPLVANHRNTPAVSRYSHTATLHNRPPCVQEKTKKHPRTDSRVDCPKREGKPLCSPAKLPTRPGENSRSPETIRSATGPETARSVPSECAPREGFPASSKRRQPPCTYTKEGVCVCLQGKT